MISSKWRELAELAGIIAILAGLYFVYDEIQQTATIARAELNSVSSQRMWELNGYMSDPEFSKLYLKGLHTPTELNETERFRLNAFYQRVLELYGFEFRNYQLGIFAEYEIVPRNSSPVFFGSGYGRIFWNVRREFYNPAIVKIVDDALANIEGDGVLLDFDSEVRKRLENN